MNQLIAIAIGGAFGAVMRFLISSGVYHWLGRDFPYGTLAVNVMGSFLIGLMTEALIVQKVMLSTEYRVAILVGLFGSLTTFSTFSLDTLYLIEQGNLSKAALNVLVSVFVCVFVVWLGLLAGRALFSYSGGVVRWMSWVIPYGLLTINGVVAFLMGLISALLITKTSLDLEYRAIVIIGEVGLFATVSSLYLILHLIEEGHDFKTHFTSIVVLFMGNSSVCVLMLWLGLLSGRS